MKLYVKIIVLSLLSSVLLNASSEAGMSYLKRGISASEISMGNTGVASFNGIGTYNINPATLLNDENKELLLSYSALFQDYNYYNLAYKTTFLNFPVAFQISNAKISGIESRLVPGELQSTFDVNYLTAQMGTAFSIQDGLRFGLSAKYLYQSVLVDDESGYAFDFGLSYKNIYDRVSLGLSVRNIGNMDGLRNVETKLPADLNAGLSYNYELKEYLINTTFLAEYQNYFADNISHIKFGCEVNYSNFISVRAGYITNSEVNKLAFGFGVKYNIIAFDYAFQPSTYDGLNNNQVISMRFMF